MSNIVNKKSKQRIAVARRRAMVAKMYLTGIIQQDIADEVGVCVGTICKDLQVIRKQWLDSGLRDFNKAKAEELAKIGIVEQEAWDAWKRSQQDFQRKKIVKGAKGKNSKSDGDGGGNGDDSQYELVTEGRVGNPKFLDIVLDCVERRCKIMGLDAPIKHTETDEDGKPISRGQRIEIVNAILLERFGEAAYLFVVDEVGEESGVEGGPGSGGENSGGPGSGGGEVIDVESIIDAESQPQPNGQSGNGQSGNGKH